MPHKPLQCPIKKYPPPPPPPQKKEVLKVFNTFVMTNLEILIHIFQSALGGRDGGRGLSNEVPGGGNHRHTPGDRQRLMNQTVTMHVQETMDGSLGWYTS